MYARTWPDEQIAALAAHQAGVISQGQLAGLCPSPAAIRRWKQQWQPLRRGLYCLEEPTWLSWCWAGILVGGSDAVVGASAATHLHGLGATPPDLITIWHGGTGQLTQLGTAGTTVQFRRALRTGRGEPPRTGVEDSLLDAAREVDEDEMVSLLTRALSQGRTHPGRILTALETRHAVRHRMTIQDVCSQASHGIESVLEWRFLQTVLRAHGLPEPQRQVKVLAGIRSDCLWPQFGLVVELDGRRWHQEAFRDMHRDNRLAMTGMMTLRYGWHDIINRPCEVAWQLHRVLQTLGAAPSMRRCRRCRLAPQPRHAQLSDW